MSKRLPARYRTTNWSSDTASLKKRGSLLIWLDREMTWLAPPDGSPGRPAVFSDAAIQFCLTIKVLFKLPLRQTTGMVASLLKMANLDWAVADDTTLCRRQKTLAVQIPYRRADGPLNLLVDSTGIKFLGDGEWQARKHGPQGRRQWRKVHLAMDTAMSDIRAVEFTPSSEGDSPVLPELLEQIPEGEEIGTVTADGAYDTRRCHTAIIAKLALHESEVDCISRGKVRVRYEFGCEVSGATTLDEGFVVGMRSFPGNPCNGHTLRPALEQVAILTD
jgi:Transposase DDE domain